MNIILVRTLSALILAPIILFSVYLGGLIFQAVILITLILGLLEWFAMCRQKSSHENKSRIAWTWLLPGAIYIMTAIISLYWLRNSTENGHIILYWLLALVWAADTGAYLAGSIIGGPRLAPTISPNKTWAGFFGAVASSAVVGIICGYILGSNGVNALLLITSIVIGVLSQMGDLLESYAKRYFGVKDSGQIIPGHGGILDRIDGLMTAAIGAAVVVYFNTGLDLS